MYVENVRSVFGISERAAQRYCDTAVRQGIFSKFIEVRCPNGSVGASAESEAELPETGHCWQEEEGQVEFNIELGVRAVGKVAKIAAVHPGVFVDKTVNLPRRQAS
jgi:hypothetical protein